MASKIIDNWKQCWRLHTVKLGATLAIVPELLWRLAEALGSVLPLVSQDIKEYLPEQVRVALALAGLLVVVVRLWRQPNVDSYFRKDS